MVHEQVSFEDAVRVNLNENEALLELTAGPWTSRECDCMPAITVRLLVCNVRLLLLFVPDLRSRMVFASEAKMYQKRLFY